MKRADDVIVLIYREGSHHNSADAELHIRFSDDYGATWTAEDTKLGGGAVTGFPMNPPTGNISYGEGMPLLMPNGDIVILMWSVTGTFPTGAQNGTYMSRSTDDGETWDTPAAVDFSGIAGDTHIYATDGWFEYDGVVYTGGRVYADDGISDSYVILLKTEDNGTTWEYVSDITSSNTQEVGLEYLGNNTIIAMIRDLGNAQAYRRYSTDMGATWGSLQNVTTATRTIGRTKVYTRAHLKGEASWWTDETLIMVGYVHQVPGSSQTRRNCIWVSNDQGEHWTSPMYIDSSSEDAGYGDIFWNPDAEEWVVVNYQGSLSAADLKQYNITISGI